MSSSSNSIHYSFSYADSVNVLRLVRESAGLSSFEFELGELKLSIVREGSMTQSTVQAIPLVQLVQPGHVPADASSASRDEALSALVPPALTAVAPAEGQAVLNAPMLGIFYRAPSPGAAPFVEEGDVIEMGDVVGLIEVMKLFTQVAADRAGRIVRIHASDKSLVEHGEPLMIIEPMNHA